MKSLIFIRECLDDLLSGRFEDDFVNQRLRQLQLWMDRMCNHPVVADSDVFKHFLTCTDEKVNGQHVRVHVCVRMCAHIATGECGTYKWDLLK